MNQFDFLKEFGAKLDQTRDFEPTQEEWNKINIQLDRIDKNKFLRNRLSFLSTYGIFILSILGLIFYCYKLNKNLRELKTSITKLELVNKGFSLNSNIVKNTEFQKSTILHFDTIYKTVFINRNINTKFTNSIEEYNKNNNFSPNPTSMGNTKVKFITKSNNINIINPNTLSRSNNKNNLLIENSDNSATSLKIEKKNNKSFIFHNILKHDSIPDYVNHLNEYISINSYEDLKNDNNFKSKLQALSKNIDNYIFKVQSRIIPQKLNFRKVDLGLFAEVQLPLSSSVKLENSFNLGLNIYYNINDKWSIHASGLFGRNDLKVIPNDLEKLNVPSINPPTLNDQLTTVDIQQYIMRIKSGLKSNIWTVNNFIFYASFDAVYELYPGQILKYEFHNKQTNENSFLQVPRDILFNNNLGFAGGIGLTYRCNKNWGLFSQFNYQQMLFDEPLFKQSIEFHLGCKARL